jgi:hypothetical protein
MSVWKFGSLLLGSSGANAYFRLASRAAFDSHDLPAWPVPGLAIGQLPVKDPAAIRSLGFMCKPKRPSGYQPCRHDR